MNVCISISSFFRFISSTFSNSFFEANFNSLLSFILIVASKSANSLTSFSFVQSSPYRDLYSPRVYDNNQNNRPDYFFLS